MMTPEKFSSLEQIDLSTLVLSAQEEFSNIIDNPENLELWEKFKAQNLKQPQELGTITINLMIANRFKGTRWAKINKYDAVANPIKKGDTIGQIFREMTEAYEFALTIQKKPHPRTLAAMEAKGIFEGV